MITDLRVPAQNVRPDTATSEEMPVGCRATWGRERERKRGRKRRSMKE